jgi:tellurite resistance protein
MTGKSEFSDEEWKLVLEGPTSAGMIVIASEPGGALRETFSMARAYADARKAHGESELLDTIVSSKPEVDHARAHSKQELTEHNMQLVHDAVELVEQKATAEELSDYKRFIVNLAQRVAEAHKGGSENEQAAVKEIAETLGIPAP